MWHVIGCFKRYFPCEDISVTISYQGRTHDFGEIPSVMQRALRSTELQKHYGGNKGKTVAIGSYPANAFGLHDMLGNVWERVEDCWHESYAGAPSDTNVWKAGDCSRRVLRGGSWRSGLPWIVRSANRFGNGFGSRGSGIGFRISRTLP